MFDKPLDRLAPGDVVARTVFDGGDQPLLTAGTVLTAGYIERLRERGFAAVAVEDGLADDVVPETLVSVQLRNTVAGHVGAIFGEVAELARDRGRGEGDVETAVGDLGERPLDLVARAAVSWSRCTPTCRN